MEGPAHWAGVWIESGDQEHRPAEEEPLAESFTDADNDYLGELFNRVKGHQVSNGAHFTRPMAALLLARFAFDVAAPDVDWNEHKRQENSRVVDLVCGSGMLFAATLT